jgi:hypothetical protein
MAADLLGALDSNPLPLGFLPSSFFLFNLASPLMAYTGLREVHLGEFTGRQEDRKL